MHTLSSARRRHCCLCAPPPPLPSTRPHCRYPPHAATALRVLPPLLSPTAAVLCTPLRLLSLSLAPLLSHAPLLLSSMRCHRLPCTATATVFCAPLPSLLLSSACHHHCYCHPHATAAAAFCALPPLLSSSTCCHCCSYLPHATTTAAVFHTPPLPLLSSTHRHCHCCLPCTTSVFHALLSSAHCHRCCLPRIATAAVFRALPLPLSSTHRCHCCPPCAATQKWRTGQQQQQLLLLLPCGGRLSSWSVTIGHRGQLSLPCCHGRHGCVVSCRRSRCRSRRSWVVMVITAIAAAIIIVVVVASLLQSSRPYCHSHGWSVIVVGHGHGCNHHATCHRHAATATRVM